MSKGGRPKVTLTLNDVERQKLEAWSRRPKTSQRLALRARIILACDQGLDNQDVAAQLRVNVVTVGKWRNASSSVASTACPTSPGRGPRAKSRTR
jgi:hypothetical protein